MVLIARPIRTARSSSGRHGRKCEHQELPPSAPPPFQSGGLGRARSRNVSAPPIQTCDHAKGTLCPGALQARIFWSQSLTEARCPETRGELIARAAFLSPSRSDSPQLFFDYQVALRDLGMRRVEADHVVHSETRAQKSLRRQASCESSPDLSECCHRLRRCKESSDDRASTNVHSKIDAAATIAASPVLPVGDDATQSTL